MSEPDTKFEYELIDKDGKPIPLRPELEINEHEKSHGAIGMLEWCARVASATSQWGFLPDGGCSPFSKVKVSFTVFEQNRWQSMTEMEMSMGDDGFVKINGRFPIVII